MLIELPPPPPKKNKVSLLGITGKVCPPELIEEVYNASNTSFIPSSNR